MTDQLSPDDVATALQQRHTQTEGAPLPPEELHAAIVAMAEWTVENGVKSGDDEAAVVAAVKLLAETAAMIDGFDTEGCDGCDGTYDAEVLDVAEELGLASSTAYDTNGDPDVTICGFCIYEDQHSDEPIPDMDPVTDAEWAKLREAEQRDTEDEIAVQKILGWSA